MVKLLYRENGFIVGFKKYDWDFFIYLFLRFFQFLFDVLLPNVFMITLWQVYKFNIFTSTLFAFLAYTGFQLIGVLMFKNKSIGMAIGKLETIDKTGLLASSSTYFYRVIFSLVYLLPFIGWLVLLPSAVSFVWNKGLSFIDLITRSQILPKCKATYFNMILTNIEEG